MRLHSRFYGFDKIANYQQILLWLPGRGHYSINPTCHAAQGAKVSSATDDVIGVFVDAATACVNAS